MDGRLLGAMRVMLSEDPESLSSVGLEDLQQWDRPVSLPSELLVMKGLVGLCTVKYKSFPTSIQQDKAIMVAPRQEASASSSAASSKPASKGFGVKPKGQKAAKEQATATGSECGATALLYRLEAKKTLEAATKIMLARLSELSRQANATTPS